MATQTNYIYNGNGSELHENKIARGNNISRKQFCTKVKKNRKKLVKKNKQKKGYLNLNHFKLLIKN